MPHDRNRILFYVVFMRNLVVAPGDRENGAVGCTYGSAEHPAALKAMPAKGDKVVSSKTALPHSTKLLPRLAQNMIFSCR